MKLLHAVTLLLVVAVASSGQGTTDPRLSAGDYVRATRPVVVTRYPDAVLTSVSTNDVDAQGNASWSIGYFSPSTREYPSASYMGPRLISVLKSQSGVSGALPSEFLDSKEALDKAKAAGLMSGTTFMNLMIDGKHKVAAWSVGVRGQRIVLDAATGAVLEIESR